MKPSSGSSGSPSTTLNQTRRMNLFWAEDIVPGFDDIGRFLLA
jgi:hypothetical protein